MKSLSPSTELARKRPAAAPRYLVQLDFTAPSAKTLRLSDQYSSALGQEWLPFVADWGSLDEALNTVDAGGRPTTAEVTFFNTKPIEGKARISDLIRTNINVTGTYEWAFAKLTVYQLFDGLVSGDEVALGVFFLEDPTDLDEELLTVRMADESLAIEDKINVTVVNRVDFPNCADSAIGQSIPRPFGTIPGAVAIPVVDSITSRLNGGITSADTTLTLDDVSRFPSSGTVHIDTEHMSYTGKTGTVNGQLTGLTRAADSTTAAAHKSRATVSEVRQGTSAYRYAAGENSGGFLIRNLKNILVNGEPPTQTPSIELAASIGGKSLAVINFPREARFFKPATTTAERDVAVSTVTVSPLNGGATSSQTRTVVASSIGGTTSTDRSMNCRVVRSGNAAGTINYWHVLRRLSGGTDVQVAAGSFAANVGGTQSFSDTRTYASTADEVLTFEYQYNNTNDGKLELIFDNYHVKDSSSTMAGGGPTDIGEVSVDIEGLQDDSSGTISGTPSLLLENCTDITRFIMTQLYPVAAASLGTWWAATRAAHAAAAYRWAFLLTFTKFSQLRRKLGEQARCVLSLEGGLWQYKFLADDPRSDLTFDYAARDVTRETPVKLSRTPRANVKNSLVIQAAWDYANSLYRYVTIKEDLTQPGLTDRIQDTVTLDFVQDTAVADAVGIYLLGQWKQQRFLYELEAMWNALPVEALDYTRIANHPTLAAFGGLNLIFRVLGKRYSPKTDTIRLQAIEAANVAPPPAPGEEQMSFNYTFNGDVEIWGGGTAAAPSGWTLTGAGATTAKNTTNKKLGTASADVVRVGTDCYLAQDVSAISGFGPAAWWQGKTVTVGAWVRATVGSRARIGVNDGVASSFSSYHSGGSGFEFLTVTRVIDNAATKVEIRLQVDTGNTTAQFDGIALIQGSTLGDYLPSGWRGRKSTLLLNTSITAGPGAGTTVFLYPTLHSTSEVPFALPFPNQVVRRLVATISTAPGVGQSVTYTVRKGGVDTALTCQITGAGIITASDLTDEIAYTIAQTFGVKAVSTAGAGAPFSIVALEVEEIPA